MSDEWLQRYQQAQVDFFREWNAALEEAEKKLLEELGETYSANDN